MSDVKWIKVDSPFGEVSLQVQHEHIVITTNTRGEPVPININGVEYKFSAYVNLGPDAPAFPNLYLDRYPWVPMPPTDKARRVLHEWIRDFVPKWIEEHPVEMQEAVVEHWKNTVNRVDAEIKDLDKKKREKLVEKSEAIDIWDREGKKLNKIQRKL